MRIKGVIVDDDSFSRNELKDLITLNFENEVELLSVFDNPDQAISFIREHNPDLIFLDIQMPGMSGFEMLDHLDSDSFEVVFCTSYNQYAIKAIQYSALDYLLKPIDNAELEKAIFRFKQKTEKTLTRLRLANLKHNLQSTTENNFQLILASRQGEHQFPANDIVRCEADSNYTAIHLVNKRKFLASKTLSEIADMLSEKNFLRIHKSHLVNSTHSIQVTPQDEMLMIDNLRLPISRRRLSEIKMVMRQLHPGLP